MRSPDVSGNADNVSASLRNHVSSLALGSDAEDQRKCLVYGA
jgi:hypothetical protein